MLWSRTVFQVVPGWKNAWSLEDFLNTGLIIVDDFFRLDALQELLLGMQFRQSLWGQRS